MNQLYQKIQDLAEKRIDFLQNNPWEWYSGETTYFEALVEELAEVKEEIKHDNTILLEDELWDIFWCQMCLLQALKKEWKIRSVEKVLERSYEKFSQRIGIDWRWGKLPWDEIKKVQQQVLQQRHNKLYK